jgi:hypothetical protein
MMANDPFRNELGQHGCLQVWPLAAQQRPYRFDERIVIVADLPPEDIHGRAPFF